MTARERSLNFLFIIQGEGRGHMTQALALARILKDAGHQVPEVLLGRSRRREPPPFFFEKIGSPVVSFSSPNFATDGQNRSVRLGQSAFGALRNLRAYRKSLSLIDDTMRRTRPDLVVNFYEPLAGIYYKLHRPTVPMVCVGHQYLAHHACFPYPGGSMASRLLFKLFTSLTSLGARRRLALSFYPASDLPTRKLIVVPPLLRREVFEQRSAETDSFLLAYLLNSGYAERIISWHRGRSDILLHCFWDNSDAPETWSPAPNITFHQLHDHKFLSMMGRCRGLLCTAGFESVCEAMYLGKPVLMVPVEGHFEQACNALDAVAAGAGIAGTTFDIDALLDFLTLRRSDATAFQDWAESASGVFLDHLVEAAGFDARGRTSATSVGATRHGTLAPFLQDA